MLVMLTAAITKVFSGAISDYLGRRRFIVVFGYALSAATKPVFPLAASAGWVFAGRFVDRIGKGLRGAPRDAIVADITPPALRGAAYGLRQALDSVGAFIGPLLAIVLMLWLANDIRTVLSRSSVARGTLKLELTESLVMENPEHAAQMLTRIRELGTGLSLDDFGTGHSSLAYLQRFPFDTIKIDQSFVRTTSRGTRPVVLKSIIALAHDLGMDVVAEGAETDSDAVELYQLGCEYAQGFAFGEPMDADAAMRLLTEERLEAAS